jgi:hypothetical protein
MWTTFNVGGIIVDCQYCGKPVGKKDAITCYTCKHKAGLLPLFIEARDELREKLGLPHMESKINVEAYDDEEL